MSKRLLITEEEKNRIKLLYESAPPSESVLVSKTNPFSDSAKDILQGKEIGVGYNNNLKEGDLFFTFDEGKIKSWVLDTINNSISGKTVRVYNEDKTQDDIVTIPKFIVAHLSLNSYGFNVPGLKQLKAPTNKDESSFKGVVNTGQYSTNQIILDEDCVLKVVSISQKPWPKEHIDDVNVKFKTDEQTSRKLGVIVWPITRLKFIPNDCFEIRKVQKQTTDF